MPTIKHTASKLSKPAAALPVVKAAIKATKKPAKAPVAKVEVTSSPVASLPVKSAAPKAVKTTKPATKLVQPTGGPASASPLKPVAKTAAKPMKAITASPAKELKFRVMTPGFIIASFNSVDTVLLVRTVFKDAVTKKPLYQALTVGRRDNDKLALAVSKIKLACYKDIKAAVIKTVNPLL